MSFPVILVREHGAPLGRQSRDMSDTKAKRIRKRRRHSFVKE